MRGLSNIPIQRKLRVVILATCSAALVVACGALFALQFYFFKRDFERDLTALAAIIGNNSIAALSFKDHASALEVLNGLRAKPRITGAALLLPSGEPLARIGDTVLSGRSFAALPAGLQARDSEWLYNYPVLQDGEILGTLVLHPDYSSQANELFRLYAAILVAVLAISFLVAALISWRLEQLILFPIQNLATTARVISRRNDYSIRAEKLTDDELGTFTDSFNGMLDQIEARDRALRHEIAERRRAEEELQRMQEQLMDASRQAGMAEVATGVLHNVGNVLNSVNVSATLISEKLGRSRVANLIRATSLLKEHERELATFLTESPKGVVLPSYLTEIAGVLMREREEASVELELLNKNIEHIKDIVARQQSYARVSGIVEPLHLQELVEDAISLNADSFERHGIVIHRRFDNLGPAAVDRHKTLQILINILRNAKHAMTDIPVDQKRLTIEILASGEQTVSVRISDTGIGIAPENLTKMFSHGFTTRKEGHGFGLHSAAVAAQQMGGHLSAESAGAGTGATFILELPLAQPATAIVSLTTAAA